MLPKVSDSFRRAFSPCLDHNHSTLCWHWNENKRTKLSAEGGVRSPLIIKVHSVGNKTSNGNAGDSEHRR